VKLNTSPIRLLLPLLVIAAVTAGCSGDDSDSSASDKPVAEVEQNTELSDSLPQDIKDAGELQVATDATYPPMEFFDTDGKTFVGFDIDLGNAIGQVLGVDVKWNNLSAASILPALDSGKFDMAITAAQDLPERREIMTFVDYFNVGSNLMVKSGNPEDISDFASLCGKSLGVQAGTAQLEDAKARQQDCGAEPIDLQTFQTNDAANLALNSGRVDAVYAQTIVNAYVMSQAEGQYEVIDGAYNEAPVGVVFSATAGASPDSELVTAIQGAVSELIENGTYDDIIKKWGLEQGAIDTATINDNQ